MKKLLTALTMVLLVSLTASAIKLPFDKYTIKREELPQTAREMLDEHFPKKKVSMIKVDRHLLQKTDYDVRLTDGTVIEFNNKGEWTRVDCKRKAVPEALVSGTVRKSVEKRFPDLNITAVRKKALYHEITLSDGTRHKYDLLGIYQGPLTADEAKEAETEENDSDPEDSGQ